MTVAITPPLPITVELAPGADPNASPSDWEFTDEGIRWRAQAGIRLVSGQDDEDAEVKPGSAEMVLDNRDGRLSPRNVLGEWYGRLRRNTPLRVGLDGVDDDFERVRVSGWGTEPVSGYSWLHSGASAWTVDGADGHYTQSGVNVVQYGILNGSVGFDVDVYSTARLPVAPTGGAWVHATVVRRVDNLNNYRLFTEFGTDGKIYVKIVRQAGSGTSTDLTTLTDSGVTYIANDLIHTHVRAIGTTLQIRVWKNSDPEPDTWDASVADSLVMGTTVGLYEWRLATNPGALTVTVSNFRVRSSIWTGQVPEWPVRWPDKSGADCVTPVSASGVLRWLNQVQPKLTDPISQQLAALNPQAYWTLQDGSDATTAGSVLPRPRGIAGRVTDGTFGSSDAPPGASSALTLNTTTTSRFTGVVNSWTIPQDGFAAMAYLRFGGLPDTTRTFFYVRAFGRVTRWTVQSDAASFTVHGYDENGNEIVDSGGQLHLIDPTKWFAIQLEASESGGTVSWAVIWHQLGSTEFRATSGSFSGAADRVRELNLMAPADSTLVSHPWVGSHTLPFVDSVFMQVSSGYAGETDTERISRVFADAGIEVFVHPGDGVPLGPQPRNATALEVGRDCEQAGWGKLYEYGAVFAYLPFAARVNPAVAMALDWSQGHIAEPPEPADDDLELINRWTSSRPNGSTRTVEDEDSIAAERLYADGGDVNVWSDPQLEDDAGFHVAVGTRDVLRWPRVVIDLVRNPELIPMWLACRPGSRITIANLPEQVAGQVADLLLLGAEQEIRQHVWRVTMTLSPGAPWTQVGVWGTAIGDSTSTVLAEDLDVSETGVNITSTWIEDTWASAGGYTWVVNGEPITVTSVTSPVGSPGAYTQTATVVRSPTLAKTHAAGERVRLLNPYRWGLRN